MLSCPNPIDAVLARKVEDKTPPVITIITPDPATTYYYGTSIDIAGTIVDYADGSTRVRGEVKSISYEEVYDKRIHGKLTPSSDGSFAFSIDAFDPVPLHGNLVIMIKATDWNGNTAEKSVLAYDRTTGPSVVVYDHGPGDFNGYTSSPAAGVTLTIRGVVEVPTFYLKYDVDPQVGTDVLDKNISYDSTTGEFSFPFSASLVGVSGELKFILRAADAEMESTTYFYLYDDPVAPQITSGTVAADNARLNLTFSKGVYHTGGTDPILADFTLSQAGGPASAALSGLIGAPAAGTTSIDLGLTVAGTPSGTETITITGAGLTDRVGNPLSPASISRLLHDKTCPGVMQVSSTLPAGSAYNAGKVVPITIVFSEPVTVAPPLTLALNIAGASAVYAAGSGTDTITLEYTVLSGHNVDRLNYSAATGLAGTVTDIEGNPASLTLPDPSLAALFSRNLCVDTIAPTPPAGVTIGSDELILKEENLAGVPFTVTGEDGTGYDLTLTNCTLIAGTDTGTLPASGFALRATGTGKFTVTVAVTITDRAGNSSSGSDTCQANLTAPGAPNVYTAANPTNDQTPTWTWTSGGGGNGTYRYQLDSNPWQETTIDSFTPAADLSETEHILYVQERNTDGNWSESGSLAILVDVTPPYPPGVTGPGSTSDHTPTWNWTPGGGGNGTFLCHLDAEPEQQITNFSFAPASPVCQGQSTLYVRERDDAGNWSGYGSWTVDLIPSAPNVWTQQSSPTTEPRPTWRWSSGCGGIGTFRYRLDNSNLSGETPTSDTSYTPTDDLTKTDHTLYVQEQDADGDWSASGSATIVIE